LADAPTFNISPKPAAIFAHILKMLLRFFLALPFDFGKALTMGGELVDICV
jgi:hypothetical protein